MESVQASVGLYFADSPPSRVPALLRLTAQDVDIPAGEKHHVVTRTYRLPVDLDLVTVQPHAHYLARQVEGTATLPGGGTVRLISIKDWDFNWQDVIATARRFLCRPAPRSSCADLPTTPRTTRATRIVHRSA
jgi:hypothetical protein